MTAPRPLQIALVILAIGIWGAVALSLSSALSDEAPEETVAAPSRPLTLGEAPPPPYLADFRDPFKPAPRLSLPKPAKRALPAPRPELRLLATIDDAALVALPSGETLFVRRGDQVGEARVTHVSRGLLRVRAGSTTYELTLTKKEDLQ